MRYEVNVSLSEINSAISAIEDYRTKIDEHASAVERAYESVSEKLKALLAEYKESYENISSDISEANYIYSCNEVELDKKDAELAKSAAAAGTTPSKCDRSVQTKLRDLINAMERQKSCFGNSISNLNSSIRALENNYSRLKKFYQEVEDALAGCYYTARDAAEYIEKAVRSLSFGERSGGGLTITSVATLGAYARSFDRSKSNVLDGNEEIISSLSDFTRVLSDEVSETSKQVVGSVTESVSQAAEVLSQASRALNDATRSLSLYLTLASRSS